LNTKEPNIKVENKTTQRIYTVAIYVQNTCLNTIFIF